MQRRLCAHTRALTQHTHTHIHTHMHTHIYTHAHTHHHNTWLHTHACARISRTASSDLVQLLLVGFCFSMAWLIEWWGLSSELGAILAGVCVSLAAAGVCACSSLFSACMHLCASAWLQQVCARAAA